MKQCMGGWCHRRVTCAHYHAPNQDGITPAERLCEGTEQYKRANHGGNAEMPHSGDYLQTVSAMFLAWAA